MKDIHDLYHQIRNAGTTPATLFLLLSELKEAGDAAAAFQGCVEALTLYPEDIRIRHLLASICLETGRLSLGESEIEKATQEIERLAPAYRLKAEIHLRAKRPDEARRALEIYRAHSPDDPEALSLLAQLQVDSKSTAPAPVPEPQPVPERLPEVVQGESTPPTPEPFVPDIATPTLAEVYFCQGQVREAVATYERFLEQDPSQADRFRPRLEELRATAFPIPPEPEEEKADPTRRKKERMIAVLESWRSRLRESADAVAPG